MDTFYRLLVKAKYKPGDASKIYKVLNTYGIDTIDKLENSPVRLGAKIAGFDLYSVIHAVVQAANTPDPPAIEEKETDNGEHS